MSSEELIRGKLIREIGRKIDTGNNASEILMARKFNTLGNLIRSEIIALRMQWFRVSSGLGFPQLERTWIVAYSTFSLLGFQTGGIRTELGPL
jgi:hypothetical protein